MVGVVASTGRRMRHFRTLFKWQWAPAGVSLTSSRKAGAHDEAYPQGERYVRPNSNHLHRKTLRGASLDARTALQRGRTLRRSSRRWPAGGRLAPLQICHAAQRLRRTSSGVVSVVRFVRQEGLWLSDSAVDPAVGRWILYNTEINMANAQNSDKGQPEHNKPSQQQPGQKNEPRRTPQSRNDRESHVGGNNRSTSRKGGGPFGNRH